MLSFFEPNRPYCLVVKLYMLGLSNTTFRKGEAANRYKKVDAGNRLKLLEDALTDACGHDDSQHFRVLVWKEEALTKEDVRTEVWAWCWEEEECPFDNLMLAER